MFCLLFFLPIFELKNLAPRLIPFFAIVEPTPFPLCLLTLALPNIVLNTGAASHAINPIGITSRLCFLILPPIFQIPFFTDFFPLALGNVKKKNYI